MARSASPEDQRARNRLEIERILDETGSQGFGMLQRPRRISDETSLAVPVIVIVKDRVRAAVTVRYAATAVALKAAVDQFVPKMRDIAQRIEREIS